jgi:hypothetical protein|tara:strand:+ start:5081 stop:5284 length:204 start_codon:yes stop_codon:yes gene_type:complete
MINTTKEAEEYFSHNPSEKVVGFALLNAEQLVQAKNADEVSGEIDVLEVKVNEDITIIMKKEHGGLE